jgi:hypothetical protein
MNPSNPNSEIETKAAQTAASFLGKELPVLRASSEGEIDAAFALMAQQRGGAFSAPPTHFYLGGATRLSRWQPIIGYPRSITFLNSLRLAV